MVNQLSPSPGQKHDQLIMTSYNKWVAGEEGRPLWIKHSINLWKLRNSKKVHNCVSQIILIIMIKLKHPNFFFYHNRVKICIWDLYLSIWKKKKRKNSLWQQTNHSPASQQQHKGIPADTSLCPQGTGLVRQGNHPDSPFFVNQHWYFANPCGEHVFSTQLPTEWIKDFIQ